MAGGQALRWHAQHYALGVGCARGCPAEELSALAADTLAEAGIAPAAVAGVFSLDLKADEAAVAALARELGVPARFFDADRLEVETPRLAHPSEAVFAEVGCHGVAEAAALAAAGPDGRLVAPKRKTGMATCAIARAAAPIVALPGRPRGRLAIVGIGPGAPSGARPRRRGRSPRPTSWSAMASISTCWGRSRPARSGATFRSAPRRHAAAMRWSARARGRPSR